VVRALFLGGGSELGPPQTSQGGSDLSDYCDLSRPCQMRELRRLMRESELRRMSQYEQRRRGILPIMSSPPIKSKIQITYQNLTPVQSNIPVTYSKTVVRNMPAVVSNIPVTSSKTVIGNIPITFSRWRGERVCTEQEILNQLEFPICQPKVVPETVEVWQIPVGVLLTCKWPQSPMAKSTFSRRWVSCFYL